MKSLPLLGTSLFAGLLIGLPVVGAGGDQDPSAKFVHGSPVWALAISSDGKTLFSGSGEFGKTCEIKVWNIDSKKMTATLGGHTSVVRSLVISPDGKTLASGSMDGTVKLWDLPVKASGTNQPRAEFRMQPGRIDSVAWSPNGKILAAGGGAGDPSKMTQIGAVNLWEVATKKKLFMLFHSNVVFSIAFSRDGKTLASADLPLRKTRPPFATAGPHDAFQGNFPDGL